MLNTHSRFTNRPTTEISFLPSNYNLNLLRTSGWYAPSGDLQNIPDHCFPYQLFVVSPNPDVYTTQFMFGILYKIIIPSVTAGDINLTDGELIKDKTGRYVFSNKRATIDYNLDGKVDEDLGSIYIKVGNEFYNIVRYTTDAESASILSDASVHLSSLDENLIILPTDVTNIKFSTEPVENADYSFLANADVLKEDSDIIIKANAILPDQPETVILDRSAIFVRSYLNGRWTLWKLLTSSFVTTQPILEDEVTHQLFNIDDLYTYIDSKLTFSDSTATTDLFGLKVEITGVYNDALYDPNRNVYGVQASGLEYDDSDDFPYEGNPEILYIAKNENKLYRWDELTQKYYCVGSDYSELEAIGGVDDGNTANGPLPKN